MEQKDIESKLEEFKKWLESRIDYYGDQAELSEHEGDIEMMNEYAHKFDALVEAAHKLKGGLA